MPDIKKQLLETLKNEYDSATEYSEKEVCESIRHESKMIAKGILLAMRMVTESLEGMVIVTEAVTDEMIEAVKESRLSILHKGISAEGKLVIDYNAMLKAYQGASNEL